MTQWVRTLIIANVVVFFVQATVPGITGALAFVPMLALYRPWTILTYMFLHGGFQHILFNMLALYFFGPDVETRLGSKRFITLYTLSGISGALLSFLFAYRRCDRRVRRDLWGDARLCDVLATQPHPDLGDHSG